MRTRVSPGFISFSFVCIIKVTKKGKERISKKTFWFVKWKLTLKRYYQSVYVCSLGETQGPFGDNYWSCVCYIGYIYTSDYLWFKIVQYNKEDK